MIEDKKIFLLLFRSSLTLATVDLKRRGRDAGQNFSLPFFPRQIPLKARTFHVQ